MSSSVNNFFESLIKGSNPHYTNTNTYESIPIYSTPVQVQHELNMSAARQQTENLTRKAENEKQDRLMPNTAIKRFPY